MCWKKGTNYCKVGVPFKEKNRLFLKFEIWGGAWIIFENRKFEIFGGSIMFYPQPQNVAILAEISVFSSKFEISTFDEDFESGHDRRLGSRTVEISTISSKIRNLYFQRSHRNFCNPSRGSNHLIMVGFENWDFKFRREHLNDDRKVWISKKI